MTATVHDLPVRSTSLVVSEVFGPTFQGEGPSTGQRAAFVRLMGCNLHCTWCDTPYTWDADRFDLTAQGERRSVESIAHDVLAMDPDILVITGGEPLLHQRHGGIESLVDAVAGGGPNRPLRIEIETNGTQAPTPLLAASSRVSFNVSPKLAHAGDPAARRIVPDAVEALRATGRARWKFVIRAAGDDHGSGADIDDDLDQVDEFVHRFGIHPRRVWVMPEGTTRQDVVEGTRRLAAPALDRGYNLTTRLHTLIWGDERGH